MSCPTSENPNYLLRCANGSNYIPFKVPNLLEEMAVRTLGHSSCPTIGEIQLEASLDHLVVIFTRAVLNDGKLHRFHIPWSNVSEFSVNLQERHSVDKNLRLVKTRITFHQFGKLPKLLRSTRVNSKDLTLQCDYWESKYYAPLLQFMIRMNAFSRMLGGKFVMSWRLHKHPNLEVEQSYSIVKCGKLKGGRFVGAELTEMDVFMCTLDFEIRPAKTILRNDVPRTVGSLTLNGNSHNQIDQMDKEEEEGLYDFS